MTKERKTTVTKVAIAVMIALLSLFVLTNLATSTKVHEKTIQSLDDKKTTVLELTAASSAAAVAITLLPGDTGTPIADKLTDLSGYFLVILSAIFLEKFLITITGYAAFRFLIPIACGLYILDVFLHIEGLKRLAIKLALFGLIIFSVIPVSVKVSDLIDDTYHSSIEDSINSAKENSQILQDTADSANGNDQSIWDKLVDKVKGGVTEIRERIENSIDRFVEAIAVMLVTSCLIPILVLLFFIWVVKMFFGLDIKMPKVQRLSTKTGAMRKSLEDKKDELED